MGSMRCTSVPCQQVGSPFLPLVVESNFLQKSQLCAFASTLVPKVIHQRLLSPKKGLSFRKALGKLGAFYPAISEILEGYGKMPYPTSGDAIFHTCVETNFFPKVKNRKLTQGYKSRYQKPHPLVMVWLCGSTSFNWSINVDYYPMSLIARE